MSKYHHLYYVGGADDPSIRRPGDDYNLNVGSGGLTLYHSRIVGNTDLKAKRQFIPWQNVLAVDEIYGTKDQTTLASLLGASTKAVDAKLVVRYRTNSGNISELILAPMTSSTKNIEKAKDAIAKKLATLASTYRQPAQNADLLKYHKMFYGGLYKGAKALLGSKKRKP